MAAQRSEVDRLRQHRLIFERAVHDRVSMDEARMRLANERWADADRRLEQCRVAKAAPASSTDGADSDERPQFGWQQWY